MDDEYVAVKTDRYCNNPDCRKRLTMDAPNWFQCSIYCMNVVWGLNNPPKNDDSVHKDN